MGKLKIGIVGPAARLRPENAEAVTAIAAERYGDRAELYFHPQCFLNQGHFAGDDAARAAAFVEVANDPSYDTLWVARGGYGCSRIAATVLPQLTEAARAKTYLGYSDAGFLLAGLYNRGFKAVHGPVVYDIRRENGANAIARALRFLVERAPDTVEPAVLKGAPVAAFNIIILGNTIGTPLQPDLTGHILMVEEVAEHLYAIDRALCHITSNANVRKAAGLMLGRCSMIPENDRPFGETEEEIARHWCAVAGIPYLGRADIGHDAENKIVPFGRWQAALA